MGAPSLSVIIPAFNAAEILPRTLARLFAQTAPPEAFEIVVVDDGSTDATAEGARDAQGPVTVRVVRQANAGLSAARNRGAAHTAGAALLFLDADVLAAPDVVAAHLRHYEGGESSSLVAVQGRTVTDPATLTGAFMRTSNLMPDLTPRRRDDLSPYHVIGRNFSVSRAGFDAVGGFDDGFPGYGWEDVDFALRFHNAGGVIRYDPDALGLHHHPMTVDQAAARQRHGGRSAVYLWQKHGRRAAMAFHLEIHPLLLPLKWVVFRAGPVTWLINAFRPWAERRERLLILNEIYNHLLWRGFYEGVFAALRLPVAAATPRDHPTGTPAPGITKAAPK